MFLSKGAALMFVAESHTFGHTLENPNSYLLMVEAPCKESRKIQCTI
jgi:hypothetical protein